LFAVSSLAILLNIFDVRYFPFTFRRLGGEVFSQGELFTEGIGIYWNAILLYWHLILFALVLLYFTWRISFKITPKLGDSGKNFSAKGCLVFVAAVAFIVLGHRGGFQDKPFKTTHLPIFLGVNKTQFIVNNSCLNIIQTMGQVGIPDFQFFHDKNELSKNFNPVHTGENFDKFHGKFAGKNVVILILESFTAQNIGFLDQQQKDHSERTFTPFLDKLLAKSLYFDGFANGTTSIDGLTSTLIGVPALFESSFITSAFSCNRTDALPDAMRRPGYSTLFFYGGKKLHVILTPSVHTLALKNTSVSMIF
jgi:phosphoglycerol transferase MdoB-like AlkP superfamily enzyme